MKGTSYQKFMPWQQGDFDEKKGGLKWCWQPFLWIAIIITIAWAILSETYKKIRYRGKSDFVPGSAKYNYRIRPEKKK